MSSIVWQRFVRRQNRRRERCPFIQTMGFKVVQVGTYIQPMEFRKQVSNIQLLLHAQFDGAGRKS